MGVLPNVTQIINDEILDTLLEAYKNGKLNIKMVVKLYCKNKLEPNILHDFGTRGRFNN